MKNVNDNGGTTNYYEEPGGFRGAPLFREWFHGHSIYTLDFDGDWRVQNAWYCKCDKTKVQFHSIRFDFTN